MPDYDDRFEEIEASVKAIARFVKEETSKAQLPKAMERRFERIEKSVEHALKAAEEAASTESEIKSLRKQLAALPAKQPNFEATLQRELGRMDDRLRPLEKSQEAARQALATAQRAESKATAIEDTTAKLLAESRANREKYDGISRKLEDDMARLEDITHTAVRASTKDMEQRVDSRLNALEALIHDSSQVIKDDIERRLSQELANIEDVLKDSGKTLTEKGMEQYLESMSRLKGNLERYVSVKTQLLESDIREIKDAVARINAPDAEGIEKRLEAIESDVSLIKESSKEVPELKAALGNIKSHVYDVEDKLAAMPFEKEITEMQKAIIETRDAMRQWEKGEDARLNDIRSRFEENMKKLHGEFEQRVKQAHGTLEEAERTFRSAYDAKELQSMRSKLGEMDKLLEENFVGDKSVHKRIAELENRLGYVNALREELSASRRGIDEKAAALQKLIEDNAAGDASVHRKLASTEAKFRDIYAKLNSVQATALPEELREAKATVAAMANRVKDMEVKLRGLGQLEHVDFEKLVKQIEQNRRLVADFDKETKSEALGFITEQLNAFAGTMDKKLPELVTKQAYLQDMAMINHKLRSIEAPDMSYLHNRVALLEAKISDIAQMMRDIHNRLPVVVE